MKGKLNLKKKIALGFLVFLLLGAAAIYTYAVRYFTEHFYKGSRINGVDCSYKTVPEVKRSIDKEIDKYFLTIKTMSGEEVIKAPHIMLDYVDDNKVDELLAEQRPLLWFLSFGNDKSVEMAANTTYDKESIDNILNSLACFDERKVTKPVDAYIKEREDGFEIIPEVVGNELDYEKVKALVIDAIDNGKTEISLVDEECYLKPNLYQDNTELIAKCESLNKIAATHITYNFGADRKEVVAWPIIKTWITKDGNGDYVKDDNGIYDVNKNLVAECIKGLASKYDTYAKEREFKTSFGTTVTLPRANYGWQVAQEQMTEDLFAAIIANEVSEKDAIYSQTAISYHNTDIGGTYVEISIKSQRMWCYKDGKLMVDTPIVTGNISKEWDTPKGGIWPIAWKTSPHTLRGEVGADGKPEYEVPVTYWMPFNRGIGIHDMPTRSEFGGDIYLTSGSRGCINTPYNAAKSIYGIVSKGTPVVVY